MRRQTDQPTRRQHADLSHRRDGSTVATHADQMQVPVPNRTQPPPSASLKLGSRPLLGEHGCCDTSDYRSQRLLWQFSRKHETQGVALCSRARPQPEAENEQRRHRMLRRLGVRAASIPKPAAPCESRSHLSFNQAISRQGLGCTDTFGAPSAALRLAARSSHRGPAMGRNTAA